MQSEILVTKREKSGSAEARRLRKSGKLPAVIYNDKGQSRLIELVRHEFEMMLRHHATENLIVDVKLDGAPLGKALLKEVQHDPVTGHVMHVDLVEISMTKKLRVSIPIKPVGTPVGVEQGGGILENVLREIEVECLPADLVEEFTVDVTHLKIGDSFLVRELALGPQFAVLTNGALAVVAVAMPRLEEAAPTAGAGAAEPEVIGKKPGEEEGEGGEAAAKGADGKDAKGGAAPTAKGAAPAKGGGAPAAKGGAAPAKGGGKGK